MASRKKQQTGENGPDAEGRVFNQVVDQSDLPTFQDDSASDNHPVERVFLGWNPPPIQAATDWLVRNFSRDDRLDMAGLLIVVPSARARMRLVQLLAQRASDADLLLLAPEIVTLGAFPEYCYAVRHPFATQMVSESAWARALSELDDDDCQVLFGQSRRQLQGGLTAVARLVAETHRRLANDIKSFNSVARALARESSESNELGRRNSAEAERWNILAAVQTRYYELLNEHELWDIQAARNVAIRRGECSLDRPLVLLGTADLNQAMVALIRQLKTPKFALIAAPESWSGRFDEVGNLRTEAWLDAEIDVPPGHWKVVESPADQAFGVMQFLTTRGRKVAYDEVTVGVPDTNLIPHLERSFHVSNVSVRNLTGRPLTDSPPYLLLDALCEYIEDPYFRNYATLVRHPDLFYWLQKANSLGTAWLADMDQFQNDALPGAIPLDSEQPFGNPEELRRAAEQMEPRDGERAERHADSVERLNQIHGCLRQLLASFDDSRRPPREWADTWRGVLVQIYGNRQLKRGEADDELLLDACRSVQSALDELGNLPREWETSMTAVEACRWALRSIADVRLIAPSSGPAVELAGWLDLALDDVPVMAVTGMNDESVPASETAHIFLPNSLCERLGIQDNQRRYARDAYVLSAIMGARDEVLLLSGRKDDANDPLKPSRLLFACEPDEVVRRSRAFFEFSDRPRFQRWLAPEVPCQPRQALMIPHPDFDHAPVTHLSVTKFRDFLKCPYRAYLRHILRLEEVQEAADELDQLKFGSLVHNVLETWGQSEFRDSENEDEIRDFLLTELRSRAHEFADANGKLKPAMQIQLKQIELRLSQFARKQAAWRADGWEIVAIEELCEYRWPTGIEDEDGNEIMFSISGKIDRVDRRQANGFVEFAVLDYKTSASGAAPKDTHGPKKDEWTDLQLPLYRHLATAIESLDGFDPSAQVQLGYVTLPKDLKKVGFKIAEWDSETLQTADQTALAIMQKIVRGEFWPPEMGQVEYMDEFAAICQDHVMERCEVTM